MKIWLVITALSWNGALHVERLEMPTMEACKTRGAAHVQWVNKLSPEWDDWVVDHCPQFDDSSEWCIKPLEPKTITICTFMNIMGDVRRCVKDSDAFVSMSKNQQWTHIKSLDQVVEVE